jgi:hypothetical protein
VNRIFQGKFREIGLPFLKLTHDFTGRPFVVSDNEANFNALKFGDVLDKNPKERFLVGNLAQHLTENDISFQLSFKFIDGESVVGQPLMHLRRRMKTFLAPEFIRNFSQRIIGHFNAHLAGCLREELLVYGGFDDILL